MDNITFPAYDEVFLEYSWHWLNDPEIKQLTMSPELTREGQQSWFRGLSGRNDYKIWGVVYRGVPVGAVGLKHIDEASEMAEYFGYIGEKAYWGKGIGKSMVEHVITFAREIGMKTVYLTVLSDNVRAIRLYEKCGFVTVAECGQSITMECLLDVSH